MQRTLSNEKILVVHALIRQLFPIGLRENRGPAEVRQPRLVLVIMRLKVSRDLGLSAGQVALRHRSCARRT